MRQLLSAELVRFRRSIFLWAVLLLALVLCAVMMMSWLQANSTFLEMGDESRILHTDGFVFYHTNYLSYLVAGFAVLYLWREFSSGGVRNKVAHGISRTMVYLSHWAAVCVCGFVLCTVVPAVCLLLGLPLYGPLQAKMSAILAAYLGTLFSGLALSSLYTAIAMTMGGSPLGMIACAVPAVLLQTAATNCKVYLVDCALRGVADAQYAWCRFWYGVLPTGQLMEYRALETAEVLPMALKSLAVAALCGTVGILLFRRQELK